MVTIEELAAELEKIKKQLASSDEAKREEAKRLYNEFRKKHGGAYYPPCPCPPTCPAGQHYDELSKTCVPDVQPPLPCPQKPDDGRPQPEKGANLDAKTWQAVPMRDDPTLSKVVDNAGINVADQFHSMQLALDYITHYKCIQAQPPGPDPICPEGQHWDAVLKSCVFDVTTCPPGQHLENGVCVPDVVVPPVGGVGPYASTGKQMDTKLGNVKVRHYASGKPDDFTRERTVTGVPYKNYQFIVETTMHAIEHDDTVSLKYGGTHMGTGWFDIGVSFEEGECCLGKEENHPSTDLCIIRGPKIGSILEKKIKVAGVYFGDRNHIELWTNLGAGWIKQVEGTNVGGFNPKSSSDDCTERIDGFVEDDSPTMDFGIVQEINDGPPPQPCPPGQHRDASGNCVPDTPTPCPPQPCPAGQHWDQAQCKCVLDTPTPCPPQPCPTGQVWDQAQCKCVPVTPPGGIIEEGVLMKHEKIGETKKFTYGSSNPGRAQWRCEIGKCMLNQEVTAIFDIHAGAVTNDGEEISIKVRGGRHTGDNPQEGSCYIIGLGYDGTVNKQYESPHPNNHAYPGHGNAGNFSVGNVDGKKIAVKAIVYQKGNQDHLECWLDTDPVNANGTFNNNYRLFWSHDADEFVGKCNGQWALLRLDDIAGAPDNPEVDLIYGSLREIKPPAGTRVTDKATKVVQDVKESFKTKSQQQKKNGGKKR